MTKNTTGVGNQAEALSCKYLLEVGYRIIERNFRNRFCEIDIVATRDNQIIFVEVKYRNSNQFGEPILAITPRKMAKMKRAAEFYLTQNAQYQNLSPVIEVITLSGDLHHPNIEHWKDIW